MNFKILCRGLPCWFSHQESACQCGGHRFDPWSGKIPHATGQPSLCTTTAEVAQQEKSLQWEAYTLQLETSPCSLQVEKACTQQQRPSTDKNKLNQSRTETGHSVTEPNLGLLAPRSEEPVYWHGCDEGSYSVYFKTSSKEEWEGQAQTPEFPSDF